MILSHMLRPCFILTLITTASLSSWWDKARADDTEVCISSWPELAQSYLLIYLDSTDGNLSVDPDGLQMTFRDPWGNVYQRMSWHRRTQSLTIQEAPEGILLDPIVLNQPTDPDYQRYLQAMINHATDFMWGYGAYTIGEPPSSPRNPELQPALTCLESLRS
jgi:hypothetical protein